MITRQRPVIPHVLLAFGAFSRHTTGSASPIPSMSDLNTIVPKTDRALLSESGRRAPEDPQQRRLMVGSLCLLLLALGIVLWHDRDFWFPDAPEAESDRPVNGSSVAKTTPAQSSPVSNSALESKPKHQV